MILNCPRKCKSQKLSKKVCCSIERKWNPCHSQIFPQRKLEVLTDGLTGRVYQTSCKLNSHVTQTVKETPRPSSFLNMTPWKIPVGKQLADCFYHQNKCPTPKHCNIWEVWVSVMGRVDAKETRVPVSKQRTAETCWQPALSMHLGWVWERDRLPDTTAYWVKRFGDTWSVSWSEQFGSIECVHQCVNKTIPEVEKEAHPSIIQPRKPSQITPWRYIHFIVTF